MRRRRRTPRRGFDPTADVPLAGEVHDGFLDRLLEAAGRVLPWALLAVVVGGVVVGAVAAVRAVGRRRSRTWAAATIARLDRAGRRRGRPRYGHETPMEDASALVRSRLPDARVAVVAAAASAAAYGGVEPSEPVRRALEADLAAAEHDHPAPPWWRRRP